MENKKGINESENSQADCRIVVEKKEKVGNFMQTKNLQNIIPAHIRDDMCSETDNLFSVNAEEIINFIQKLNKEYEKSKFFEKEIYLCYNVYYNIADKKTLSTTGAFVICKKEYGILQTLKSFEIKRNYNISSNFRKKLKCLEKLKDIF